MKSLRFADLSLVVKMALAPAFAVLVLAIVAGGAFVSQQAQTQAIDQIVQKDMKVSLKLANVSERITGAHLQIYQLLTNQAGGLAAADAPAKLTALMGEVDAIKAELNKLKADLPESEQKRFAEL